MLLHFIIIFLNWRYENYITWLEYLYDMVIYKYLVQSFNNYNLAISRTRAGTKYFWPRDFYVQQSDVAGKFEGQLSVPQVRLPWQSVSASQSPSFRWVSVVEFHDRALGIGKAFGQESTVVEWNYQILALHQVTVRQKLGIILVIKWF